MVTDRTARIYVSGHCGLVGSALLRQLQSLGYRNLITYSRGELDLRSRAAVDSMFDSQRPEYVFLAAARVGGIGANLARPAEFIHDNLLIQANVIDAAYKYGAAKLLFLGSNCMYPRAATQPVSETSLLRGELEPSNEAYALAKIVGITMCQAYRRQFGFNAIVAVPCNLYGPCDNFDLSAAHVLPALIRKFYDAQQAGCSELVVWGTGRPRREFLHADDLAQACMLLMDTYDQPEPVNIGAGFDLTVAELAKLMAGIVGFRGSLIFDAEKPDGVPGKLLDISRIAALGWRPRIALPDGIASTWRWFEEHRDLARNAASRAAPDDSIRLRSMQ